MKIRFFIWVAVITAYAFGEDKAILRCGVANGFPPYQFKTQGVTTGIDVEVCKSVIHAMEADAVLVQKSWEDVVSLLYLNKELHIVAGMEVTELRKAKFAFSTPYYKRKSVVFVQEDSPVRELPDMYSFVISGDRGSYSEQILLESGKFKGKINRYFSKKDAFIQLMRGEVQAVIAPEAVGRYFASQMGVPVRVIDTGDMGTPVSLAVRKSDKHMLPGINSILQKMLEANKIQSIIDSYRK